MKTENGKIIAATEAELFSLYLDRGMDDCMDFYEYLSRMERSGCAVLEEDSMLMYEDLKTLYAVTAKERDELKRENEYLRKIVEKQARMNRVGALTALELDRVMTELNMMLEKLEVRDG